MVKSINTMKKLHQLTGKTASQHQSGRIKFTYNNINPKCKWANAPIKRHRLANRIKSQNPLVCCVQETHLTCNDTQKLKIKKWRNIYQANGKQKKAGVAILVSDKIDFKPTKSKRDKEGYYIMVKGTMYHKELMILNIYGPNTGAPRYIRPVLNDL